MKKIIIFCAVFIAFFSFATKAQEEFDAFSDLNIYDIEKSVSEEGMENIQDALSGFSFKNSIEQIMGGETELNPGSILKQFIRLFAREVYLNFKVMGALIIISAMCACLNVLQSSFSKEGAGKVAFYAGYALIAGLAGEAFSSAVQSCTNAIDDLVLFMQAAVPALGTLLISSGAPITASSMMANVLLIAQICAIVIKNVILPLSFATLAVSMANHLLENAQLTRLVKLGKSTSKWILGIMMTVFTTALALSGFAGGAADGIGGKTARYAVSHLIPVAGGALSDTVEAVAASALILKNAVGITGIIFILLLCVVPILKVMALMVIYKVVAAIMQPISDSRFSSAVDELGECTGMLLAMIMVVVVLMIISIAAMLKAGNMSAMLR